MCDASISLRKSPSKFHSARRAVSLRHGRLLRRIHSWRTRGSFQSTQPQTHAHVVDATRSEAERRAREEREYWDGWYRLLTCGTAPNPRDLERGRGAGAGVAGYADSDDDEEEDATGRHTGGRCRVHGLGLGCAISCCCLEPNRRSRSFQDLRESVSPRTSPRTSPRPSPSRPTRR